MKEAFQKNTASVVEDLRRVRIVPVLVLNTFDEGMKMCEVLSKNGLLAAEITFRTSAAAEIIAGASKRFPELVLGAGTVLNIKDLKRAIDAGAQFAVSPGFNPTVVRAAVECGFPFAPGICIPGEIEQAYELGCRFLKFFPAEAMGGVKMLKNLIGPYRHLGIQIMPTGGVNAKNAADYLAVPEIPAVGGTWLAKADDLKAENWDKIAGLVAETAIFRQ
ncbi:MAG: bifunctional 4-hydroxy-2-oxoglutarate aldolase/2-dehydro-3-deoxy-phosphogluconate aldolase [Lentisphaeria bacterium]